ncbi:MAG: Plug domain-containing protein, partial [Serpentinimonas sp.]|nr:Plug domain-containing protein [Serpentinimonas sp.]
MEPTQPIPQPAAACLRLCRRSGGTGSALRAPVHALAWLACLGLLGLAGGAVQAQPMPPLELLAQAEPDFFSDQPPQQVLSVTRLAQPLADAPGAVTVLDRQTLRRSGARTVTEALRLVPGYMVAGYSGANLMAAYHAPVDEYGVRSLILVDGRSLYSP